MKFLYVNNINDIIIFLCFKFVLFIIEDYKILRLLE